MPEARHSMLLLDARQTSPLPANARCHIAQFACRISICARCRAPRKDVATRSRRAPILARAGTHGAARAPLAGYLGLASKRLR